MAIEVNSYKDRNGIRVRIGDTVGYVPAIGKRAGVCLFKGKLNRIKKSGYFIELFVEGRPSSLSSLEVIRVEADA